MANYRIQYVCNDRFSKEEDVMTVLRDLRIVYDSCSRMHLIWNSRGMPLQSFEDLLEVVTSSVPVVRLERVNNTNLGLLGDVEFDFSLLNKALESWGSTTNGTCPACEHYNMEPARNVADVILFCDDAHNIDEGYLGRCSSFSPAIRHTTSRGRTLKDLVKMITLEPSFVDID
ncbi:MAG: hypothetical protein ABIA93_02595 [Candidatus Woesearchaeota archaeon]